MVLFLLLLWYVSCEDWCLVSEITSFSLQVDSYNIDSDQFTTSLRVLDIQGSIVDYNQNVDTEWTQTGVPATLMIVKAEDVNGNIVYFADSWENYPDAVDAGWIAYMQPLYEYGGGTPANPMGVIGVEQYEDVIIYDATSPCLWYNQASDQCGTEVVFVFPYEVKVIEMFDWEALDSYDGAATDNYYDVDYFTYIDCPIDDDVQMEEYYDEENDCYNYEGEYVAGYAQCGFDEEHFQSEDQDAAIASIDQILEDMEQDFVDEADALEETLDTYYTGKVDAYTICKTNEDDFLAKQADRIAAEAAYNTARLAEEDAHDLYLGAYGDLETACLLYSSTYDDYVERIDFLNYELFIIQQIRELLGEEIGYVPEQIVLEARDFQNMYGDVDVDEYSAVDAHLLGESAFEHDVQRFQKRRQRTTTTTTKRRRRTRTRS